MVESQDPALARWAFLSVCRSNFPKGGRGTLKLLLATNKRAGPQYRTCGSKARIECADAGTRLQLPDVDEATPGRILQACKD